MRRVIALTLLLGCLTTSAWAGDKEDYTRRYGPPYEKDVSKTQETLYWYSNTHTRFATFRQNRLFAEGRIIHCKSLQEQRKVLLQQLGKHIRIYGSMKTRNLGVKGAYEFLFQNDQEHVWLLATEDMLHTVIIIRKKV